MRLLKIGRDMSCDIALHSTKVSSLHAELTLLNNGDILLEDKGSVNGTFVMNVPIKPGKPVNVRRGDAIRFADVELQWSQIPMPEDNSAYKGIYSIGTHFNNDFQISGATVSRYHATVKHGKDNKMYIFDHSKNGTTVDGIKLTSNSPYRIKKSSAVVCGGVPVDLSRLPWPSSAWKTTLGIVASIIVLIGIGVGVYMSDIIPGLFGGTMTDKELYDRHKSSVVMLKSIYHYEVSINGLSIDEFNEYCAKYFGKRIPKKVLYFNKKLHNVSELDNKEYITLIDKITDEKGMSLGTGFFISPDGKLITNLHVVKPWLGLKSEDNMEEEIKRVYKRDFAEIVGKLTAINSSFAALQAYIEEINVKGVLTKIILVPQGEIFSSESMRTCKVLYAEGNNLDKDVALIDMYGNGLPDGCTYVNVKDSMDLSKDAYNVGTKVATIGYPNPTNIQDFNSEKGIKPVFASSRINKEDEVYRFAFDAISAGGASGSPIFNQRGFLIGVLNSGIRTQPMTYGIKSKYIKEILDKYNSK